MSQPATQFVDRLGRPLHGGYSDEILKTPDDIALYDTVEVNPITTWTDADGTINCETVDADNSQAPIDFWSAYLRQKEGGVECMGDFPTQAEASDYAARVARKYGYEQGHGVVPPSAILVKPQSIEDLMEAVNRALTILNDSKAAYSVAFALRERASVLEVELRNQLSRNSAADLLVRAYANGGESSSVDWEDLNLAYEAAQEEMDAAFEGRLPHTEVDRSAGEDSEHEGPSPG